MWTPKLHEWQSEVSGWLLHCAQAELWHLHELRDEPLEEHGALGSIGLLSLAAARESQRRRIGEGRTEIGWVLQLHGGAAVERSEAGAVGQQRRGGGGSARRKRGVVARDGRKLRAKNTGG